MTESMDVKVKDITNPKKITRKGIIMLENGVGASLDKYTAETLKQFAPNLAKYPSFFGFFRGIVYGLITGSIKDKNLEEVLKGAFAGASADFVMNLGKDIKTWVAKIKGGSTPATVSASPASVAPIRQNPMIKIPHPTRRPVGIRRRFWR